MSLFKLKALGLSYLNDDLYDSFIKKLAEETFYENKNYYKLSDIDGIGNNKMFSDDLSDAIITTAYKSLKNIENETESNFGFAKFNNPYIFEKLVVNLIENKEFKLMNIMMESSGNGREILERQLNINQNYNSFYNFEEKKEILISMLEVNENKNEFIKNFSKNVIYGLNYNISLSKIYYETNGFSEEHRTNENKSINKSLNFLLELKDFNMKELFLNELKINYGISPEIQVLMFKSINYSDKDIFNFIKENMDNSNVYQNIKVIQILLPHLKEDDILETKLQFINDKDLVINIENNKNNLDIFKNLVKVIKDESDTELQNRFLEKFKDNFKLDKSFSLNDLNFDFEYVHNISDSIDSDMFDSTNNKNLEEAKQRIFDEDLHTLN